MAKDELSIAALQLNSQADVAENLEACRRLIGRAASRGAEVVVLPENFAFFGPEAEKHQIAESLSDGPISSALAGMAREFRVALVAGGFPELSGDQQRPHNSLLVIGADGSRLGTYRKIHLFDVELGSSGSYSESAATLAGKAPLVVEVGGFKLGLSICYDLRFPELYRALSEQGAEVILVPAAFTLHTGKDHWHVLLRARAIESQAYRPTRHPPRLAQHLRPRLDRRSVGHRHRRSLRRRRLGERHARTLPPRVDPPQFAQPQAPQTGPQAVTVGINRKAGRREDFLAPQRNVARVALLGACTRLEYRRTRRIGTAPQNKPLNGATRRSPSRTGLPAFQPSCLSSRPATTNAVALSRSRYLTARARCSSSRRGAPSASRRPVRRPWRG